MKKASNTASIMTAGKTNNNGGWKYGNPKSFITESKSGSQVRLTGLNQSVISDMVKSISYLKSHGWSDRQIADSFPVIHTYKGKKSKKKNNVSDGNHRIESFILSGISEIRYVEESYSSGHAKIKDQIGKNLLPANTPLNKRNRVHALRSYMAEVDADKSIKSSSPEYHLKGFAKKMEKDSSKALSNASPLVEELFKCCDKTAKEYLAKAVVVDDPKQRSWSRTDLVGTRDDESNKKYGIMKPTSTKKPSNNYFVITVFNSGYLWNNALASAYKVKSQYPKCKIILRVADDGRGKQHLDDFRENIIYEVNKINNSGLLGRGISLFDIVQVAPQKTGYEDPALEEKGFFEVVDNHRLKKNSKPSFDWKSTPKGGWDTTTGISEEEVQEYLLSMKKKK